jgi:glutathione S-transferase
MCHPSEPSITLTLEISMKLYEFGPTRSIRVRWTLQELGVDFDAISVNLAAGEHRRPEFLKLNPTGKIPVLIDGDLVLSESVAIVKYLAEKYPDRGLLPTSLQDRAEVDRWLLFTATELEQPLWRITRHRSLYPVNDRSPADVALASREFKEMAAIAEQRLRDRQFVVGDRVTVADFVLAYTLDWANEIGLLGDCPNLRAYIERMYSRPRAAPRISAAMRSVGLA